MNKKEVRIIDRDNNNIGINYINTSIREELKAIQRSIALLRQDLPKIINDELIKFLNNRQGRRF